MRTVRTETVVFVIVDLVGVIALGAIGGSVDSPRVDGGRYEVTFPSDQFLIPQSESESTPPITEIAVGGQTLDLSGGTGWLPPLGGALVLALWALIAMRTMGGPAVVFMAMTGVLLLALVLMVGPGGPVTGRGVTPEQSLSWFEQVVFLMIGLVTVLSGVALFLPDDADAYTTAFSLVPFLGKVVADLRSDEGSSTRPDRPGPPDNAVYRVWQDFSTRFGRGTDIGAGSRATGTMTPGEVARRAEAAGAPTEAVSDLRRVFEQVRYGPDPPSAAHVERAEDAWAEIRRHVDAKTETRTETEIQTKNVNGDRNENLVVEDQERCDDA